MHSGRKIDACAPRIEAIWMGDIAAQLSKIALYNGATHCFFSEAHHAVIVADELAKGEGPLGALYGLLHDAHLTVRTANDGERQAVARAIYESIDLDWPVPDTINRALLHVHAKVVLAEIQQLATGWGDIVGVMLREGITPIRMVIKPMTWDRAQDRFIERLRGYAVAANLRPAPALEGLL